MIAEMYPGVRIAIARAHKARLVESVMNSMRKVLAHHKPYLFRGSDRSREAYEYKNGSKIIPTALDDPERQKSVEAEVWYINEVGECQEDNYTMVLRAMRSGVCPWRVLLSDVNPGPRFSWVNQRCKDINPEGRMYRLKSWIQDNPYFWDSTRACLTAEGEDYVGSKLSNLSPIQHRRLVKGEWCSEEGLVWENYDDSVHLVDGELIKREDGWWVEVKGEDPWRVKWFFGDVDWGWENPGAMHVWAVDGDGRVMCVREWYHTHKLIDWWADEASKAQQELGVVRYICDASSPGNIRMFNKRMGIAEERKGAWVAIPAEVMHRKAAKAGELTTLDQVRWGFETDGTGVPRIRFLRNALQHEPDPELRKRRRPTCTTEEVVAYVFEEPPATRPEFIQETPRKLNDHGCNAMEYGYTWAYKRNFAPLEEEPMFPPGSFGDLMGHAEILNPPTKGRQRFA